MLNEITIKIGIHYTLCEWHTFLTHKTLLTINLKLALRDAAAALRCTTEREMNLRYDEMKTIANTRPAARKNRYLL